MASFCFIHAADLHLDSPLLGLRSKSETWAAIVERASRQAFENLIVLAQTERCRFVVLAGDVFDGALRNFQTGLFFMAGMRRLNEAGIEVFVILGNHDAENQFAQALPMADNVHVFASDAPSTYLLADVGVSIHGQSFAQRDVTENLARQYPPPTPQHFNIGVLHTACAGSEDHAPYAPCTVAQLVHHGYDYWALGHIHARSVLHEHPHVIFPGNLQGRSPKELGVKGASVVHVDAGRVMGVVHHELDVVRWAEASVDISGVSSLDEVIKRVRADLRDVTRTARQKPVALRLHLTGRTPQHAALQLHVDDVRQKMQTLCTFISPNLWLERVCIATQPPAEPQGSIDPTVSGALSRFVAESVTDGSAQALVATRLRELKIRMRPGADADALMHRLAADGAGTAAELALALIHDSASFDASV